MRSKRISENLSKSELSLHEQQRTELEFIVSSQEIECKVWMHQLSVFSLFLLQLRMLLLARLINRQDVVFRGFGRRSP